MKTTIEISDELMMRARRVALERRTTLRAIVEEALQRALGPDLQEVPALRTVTWGPARSGRHALLDEESVRAAIAREREGSLDDPDEWATRLGLVPAGMRKK